MNKGIKHYIHLYIVLFLLSGMALFCDISDLIVSLDNIYQREYKRLSDRLFGVL